MTKQLKIHDLHETRSLICSLKEHILQPYLNMYWLGRTSVNLLVILLVPQIKFYYVSHTLYCKLHKPCPKCSNKDPYVKPFQEGEFLTCNECFENALISSNCLVICRRVCRCMRCWIFACHSILGSQGLV